MTQHIIIEGKKVKEESIVNYYFGKGEVIGTVFGGKAEIKKDLKKYVNKGYKYIYFIVNNSHIVKIIDLNKKKIKRRIK